MVDVPCNTLVRVLPPVRGQKQSPRGRPRKPAWVRGVRERLLVIRAVEEHPRTPYGLSNAAKTVPVDDIVAAITETITQVLQRSEETRIYHWHATTQTFPPRRTPPRRPNYS